MVKTNLIASRPRMERTGYKDEKAFRAKIGSLMQMAVREADFSLPIKRHGPLSPVSLRQDW